VAIDAERNAVEDGDREITASAVPVRTFVVTAREDLEIARQVNELLGVARRS
jgi:acetate kinase